MKAKILVADDSVTIQKIVAMSFENEDIGVVGVNNGKQAFEKMYEVRPDIVLADTDMPGLTGYQLSKKIKESKEFSSVKVLLLTSDFEDFNQALYESCKADGRISKPFKSDEIIKRVNELLGASGSQEEPELLSLSAIDIVDEGDLPQAILLEEDSIVTTPDNKVEDVPHTPQAKTEDEFDFDDIFKDTFETSTDMTPAPESANLGGGKLAGEQGFDETATLASMVQEIESMDWLDESPKEEANLAGNTTSQLEETRDSSILDKMVEDLENLTRPEMEMSVEAKAGAFEDIEFEISNAKVESPDELDKAFNQLKSSKPAPAVRQSGVPPKVEKEQAAKPTIKNLEPEPDDLLEKLAPSAFSRQNELRPDLIKESLAFLSEHKPGKKNGKKEEASERSTVFSPILEHTEGKLNLMLGDHINAILEKSLSDAIKSEVNGLSDVIMQSVREVVREVTPQIAREIIREEIEKIRDLEDM